jgi:ABC-type sulfate transport system permease component
VVAGHGVILAAFFVYPPHPPKRAQDVFQKANRAAKAATAKPGSDRRSETLSHVYHYK